MRTGATNRGHVRHPQILAEDLVVTLDNRMGGRYRTMSKPMKFAETPGPQPPSPIFGQHRDEILAGHGYSAAEIAALRDRVVVR